MTITLVNGEKFDLHHYDQLSVLSESEGTGLSDTKDGFINDIVPWLENDLDYMYFTNSTNQDFLYVLKKDIVSFSAI